MEKTIPEKRTVTSNRHLFYCDGCGVFLGESAEYEDGYYANIGDYTWKYYDKSCDWLEERGNYCPECQAKVAHQIMSALGNLGFRQER